MAQSLEARQGTTLNSWNGMRLSIQNRYYDTGATKLSFSVAYTYNADGTFNRIVKTYYMVDGVTVFLQLQYDYAWFTRRRMNAEVVTVLVPA